MRIRHLNRGDVSEGGCQLCKPRVKRYLEEIPMPFLVSEGIEEYESEIEEAAHEEVESWT